VGVLSVALGGQVVAGIEPAAWLDHIIERADLVMFEAKRQGGNSTIHVPAVDGRG
jgi:predicted NAD/FAD-binding protein